MAAAEFFCPPGIGPDEWAAVARRSAAESGEPQLLHRHADGQPCAEACSLLQPDGSEEPIASAAAAILGSKLTEALEANRRSQAES